MAEKKPTENQLSQEWNFLLKYYKKMKTPNKKEYKTLLLTTAAQLAALGTIGFGIKFVHMIINKMLISNP